ncbi:phage exclusion protein Lit family protein [Pseudomonas sp. P5_A2_2]
MSDARSDQQIQEAVRQQFLGVAPEHADELEKLWVDYQLQFSLLADGDRVEMEGGLYRHVRFNHRALRIMWISAFAAWEAYACASEATLGGRMRDTRRLKELVDLAFAVRDASDPESISLGDLPPPGNFPDLQYPHLRAPAELAMFVSGWAMLHEIQHCICQQDGTSSTDGDIESKHAEELRCDAYATRFVMDGVSAYTNGSGEEGSLVKRKRATGIYFATFALALLSHGAWAESESHPSIETRIEAIRQQVSGDVLDEPLLIAALAFVSLGDVLEGAPALLFGSTVSSTV